MRELIFAIAFLSCTATAPQPPDLVTVMIKPHQGGFEIYHPAGALLFEILPGDSLECDLFETIIDQVKHFETNPNHWQDTPETPIDNPQDRAYLRQTPCIEGLPIPLADLRRL